MTNALRLYLQLVMTSVRGQMQYHASFLMQVMGQFTIVIEFLAIWALFSRFGTLAGWTLPEVGLLYGIVHLQWGITDLIGRGFDSFGERVRTGEFDRMLLRPRSTLLQLAGAEVRIGRVGRIAQAAVVFAWALTQLGIDWSIPKLLLLVVTLAAGVALFLGMLILQAIFCFWTIEGLEVANIFTHGGIETARYPMAIYPPWFRRLFTVVVPLGAVTYYPALALLGREDPLGSPAWFQWSAPLLALAFFAAATQVWRFGLRRYHSTGS